MRVNEVAKTIMKISNVTQKELAEKFGKSGQSTISMILQAKNMRIDNLLMILNECGYELVARSIDGERPEYIIGDETGDRTHLQDQTDGIRKIVKSILDEELANRGIETRKHLAIEFAEDEPVELDEDI